VDGEHCGEALIVPRRVGVGVLDPRPLAAAVVLLEPGRGASLSAVSTALAFVAALTALGLPRPRNDQSPCPYPATNLGSAAGEQRGGAALLPPAPPLSPMLAAVRGALVAAGAPGALSRAAAELAQLGPSAAGRGNGSRGAAVLAVRAEAAARDMVTVLHLAPPQTKGEPEDELAGEPVGRCSEPSEATEAVKALVALLGTAAGARSSGDGRTLGAAETGTGPLVQVYHMLASIPSGGCRVRLEPTFDSMVIGQVRFTPARERNP